MASFPIRINGIAKFVGDDAGCLIPRDALELSLAALAYALLRDTAGDQGD